MNHAALIEVLGGFRAVAALTHRHPTTTFKWTHRGIPPALWGVLVRLAQARGVMVTVEDLEKTAPQVSLRRRNHANPRKRGNAMTRKGPSANAPPRLEGDGSG